MPFYEYECQSCGIREEDFRPIDERLTGQSCSICGGWAKFVVSPTRTDFVHCEKAVRIPSNPKSVYIRRK